MFDDSMQHLVLQKLTGSSPASRVEAQDADDHTCASHLVPTITNVLEL